MQNRHIEDYRWWYDMATAIRALPRKPMFYQDAIKDDFEDKLTMLARYCDHEAMRCQECIDEFKASARSAKS